jgi:SAM-dependent methyltransferase
MYHRTLRLLTALAVDGSRDLFGYHGQAELYRAFRPTYPSNVIQDILLACPKANRNSYLDVACGSGQLTEQVAPHFQKSVGVDRSLEQLGQAKRASLVEYRAGSAFALPVPPGSVDLITVAQGLHWLRPYDRFFDEVDRVLRPGGAFCAVAYSIPHVWSSPAAAQAFHRFYVELLGADRAPGEPGCWWDTNRKTVDGQYQDIPFPRSVCRTSRPQHVRLLVSHFINYLKSLSAYQTLIASGHSPDPLVSLEADLLRICGTSLDIEIPFFSVVFHKPPNVSGGRHHEM